MSSLSDDIDSLMHDIDNLTIPMAVAIHDDEHNDEHNDLKDLEEEIKNLEMDVKNLKENDDSPLSSYKKEQENQKHQEQEQEKQEKKSRVIDLIDFTRESLHVNKPVQLLRPDEYITMLDIALNNFITFVNNKASDAASKGYTFFKIEQDHVKSVEFLAILKNYYEINFENGIYTVHLRDKTKDVYKNKLLTLFN